MADYKTLGGVTQTGLTTPTDTDDEYAVIDPLLGIGGFRNVANGVAGLNTIPILRRRVGIDDGTTYYKLKLPHPTNGWAMTIADWESFSPGGLVTNTKNGKVPSTGPFNPSTSISNNVGKVPTVDAGGTIYYKHPGTKVVKVFAFENFDIPVFISSLINITAPFGDFVSAKGEIVEGIAGQRGDVVLSDVINPTIPINFIVNGVETKTLTFTLSCGDSFYIRKLYPIGTLITPNIEVYITKVAESAGLATDVLNGIVPMTGGATKAGFNLSVNNTGDGYEVKFGSSLTSFPLKIGGNVIQIPTFDVANYPTDGVRNAATFYNIRDSATTDTLITNSGSVPMLLVSVDGVESSITNYTFKKYETISIHYEKVSNIIIIQEWNSSARTLPEPTLAQKGFSPVINATGDGWEVKRVNTGIVALPPVGYPFIFPSFDLAPLIGTALTNTPIIYYINDQNLQGTISMFNTASDLIILKDGKYTNLGSGTYNAKIGEMLYVYEAFNGEMVINVVDTVVRSYYIDSSDTTKWKPLQTTEALLTNNNTLEEYMKLDFICDLEGKYRLDIDITHSTNLTTSNFIANVVIDENSIEILNEEVIAIESKDAAGVGVVINTLSAGVITGNLNSGTNVRMTGRSSKVVDLVKGKTYGFYLKFRNEVAGTRATVYKSIITLNKL